MQLDRTHAPKVFEGNTKTFNGHPIGITMHEGRPWLVAVDIAKALGYGNSAKVIHCINPLNVNREGYTLTINEAGIQELADKGRKPLLPQFSQWAVQEVFNKVQPTVAPVSQPVCKPSGVPAGCPFGFLMQMFQQMQQAGRGCGCSCGRN